MANDVLVDHLSAVKYKPRLLELALPQDLLEPLSDEAQWFFSLMATEKGLVLDKLLDDRWPQDSALRVAYQNASRAARLEILCIINVYLHEMTHKVDFLISPFGLQYYTSMMREYWVLQQFMPRILDDPKTVDNVRFLVALSDDFPAGSSVEEGLRALWKKLKPLVHLSYAWGDVADVTPLGKYIKPGWAPNIQGLSDPFHVGMVFEPVTILDFFHSFRPSDHRFWYLRPLTLFESKAVCNTLLYTLHLLGPEGMDLGLEGMDDCKLFFKKVYADRKADQPPDYLFLLDVVAKIYKHDDFYSLLKAGVFEEVRSALVILSSLCWYALQAPPPLKGDDGRSGNPVLRFWVGFMLVRAVMEGRIKAPRSSMAEMLLAVDEQPDLELFYQKPIGASLEACRKVVDHLIKHNKENTWNPWMRDHFNHILSLMRPHFVGREASYTSGLGMPDCGNPRLYTNRAEDMELFYTDYQVPRAASEWFNIRSDLYFHFTDKPATDILDQVDQHFLALLVPYLCPNGHGITTKWVSRFAESYTVRCPQCGHSETFSREDTTRIVARR